MDFTLTEQQILRIQNWMDGKAPAPTEELGAYFRLGEAIRRKLMTDATTAAAKAARLEERVERYRQRDNQLAEQGVFDCLGLDSVELAKAVLWSAYRQRLFVENKMKLRLVVYGVYCAWLGSARQRATIEHPVAQCAYGPTLPKMLNESRVDYRMTPTDECYRKICELEAGLAKTIDNCVSKYLSHSVKELEGYFSGKDTPFAKASAQAKKEGKSMMEIPDGDIWLWKQTHSL